MELLEVLASWLKVSRPNGVVYYMAFRGSWIKDRTLGDVIVRAYCQGVSNETHKLWPVSSYRLPGLDLSIVLEAVTHRIASWYRGDAALELDQPQLGHLIPSC